MRLLEFCILLFAQEKWHTRHYCETADTAHLARAIFDMVVNGLQFL
jgi:hypothetical protein